MIRAPWPDAYRDDVAWARVLAGRGFDLLVVGLAVVSEIEIWVSDVPGPTWVLAPGVLLYTLPLLFRRRFPFLAPVFVFGVHIAISFADPQPRAAWTPGRSRCCSRSGRWAPATTASWRSPGWVSVWAPWRSSPPRTIASSHPGGQQRASSTAWPGCSRSCWPDGADAPAPPRQRAAQLERDQHERARAAVAEERARIARELHDVIAHSVSVMTVQAGRRADAASGAPGAGHAAAARGRGDRPAGAAEMRRLLGILREDDAPRPGAAAGPGDLPTLAEAVRHAGLPVEVTVEGKPRPLPAGVDLTAYRIVQEALTNTLKHAGPTRATVVVRYDARRCSSWRSATTARAPASADGTGHGLIGMRERVSAVRRPLRAGPGPNGGFAVSARLPLEAAPP